MIKEKIIKILIIVSIVTLVITTCLFFMNKDIFKESYALVESNNLSSTIIVNDTQNDFSNTESVSLEYNGTSSKVYDININLFNVPSTATDIELKISLAEGVIFESYGTVGNTLLSSYLKDNGIIYDTNKNIYGYESKNSGDVNYKLKDGTVSFTLPIKISLDEVFFVSEINNPVTVSLSYKNNNINYSDQNILKKITVNLDSIRGTYWFDAYASVSKYIITSTKYNMKDFGSSNSEKVWSYSFVNGTSYPGKKKLAKKVLLNLSIEDKDNNNLIDNVLVSVDSGWEIEKKSDCYVISKSEFLGNDYVSIPWSINVSDDILVNEFYINGTLTYIYYDGTSATSSFKKTFLISDKGEHTWLGYTYNTKAKNNENKLLLASSSLNMASEKVKDNGLDAINSYVGFFSSLGNYGDTDSSNKIIEFIFDDDNNIGDIARFRGISNSLFNKKLYCTSDDGSDCLFVKIVENGAVSSWKKAKITSNLTDGSIYVNYIYLIDEGRYLTKDDIVYSLKFFIDIIPKLYEQRVIGYFTTLDNSNYEKMFVKLYNSTYTDTNNNASSINIKDDVLDDKYLNAMHTITYNTAGKPSTSGFRQIDSSYVVDENSNNNYYDVSYYIDSGDSSGSFTTMYPIFYIRDITGTIDRSSIKIQTISVTNALYDLLVENVDYTISSFVDNEGYNVYKITSITDKLCIYCLHLSKFFYNNLKISFHINVNNSTNSGTYYFKDMLFIEQPNKNYYFLSYPTKNTLYDKNSNIYNILNTSDNIITPNNSDGDSGYGTISGVGTDLLGTFFEIKSKADIVISNTLKINNKDYIWNNTEESIPKINNDSHFVLTEQIKNQAGILTGKNSIIYIPIPKSFDNWGTLSNNKDFTWNAELRSLISNSSDKVKISYGKITPKTTYEEINSQLFVTNPSNLNEINCIKVEIISNLSKDEIIDINIDLVIKSTLDTENTSNIFKPIYYRNIINVDNEIYSGVAYGDYTALKSYNESILTIKYIDVDGNTLSDNKIIKKEVNSLYEEYAIEIENYVLKDTIGNNKGKFTFENQTITFIYESSIGKNIIVKYLDENDDIIDSPISVCDNMNKGEECVITCKEIDKFILNTDSFNVAISEEQQIKICKYEHKKGFVNIKYVLEDGTLIKEFKQSGNLDDDYIIKYETLDGYDFVSISDNNIGIYSDEEETVIITYKIIEKDNSNIKDVVNPSTGIKTLFIVIPVIIFGIIFYLKRKKSYIN